MTVENFKGLVLNSIMYQNSHLANASMTYVTIDDKCLCVFCGQEMQTTKTDIGWRKFCYCKEAIELFERTREIQAELFKSEVALDAIHKRTNERALERYKDYLKDKLIPEMEAKQKTLNEELLNVTF